MHLRNSVLWFAQCMEANLRKHDERPGWEDDDPLDLFEHLKEEVKELNHELILVDRDEVRVISEAADVANMAMMVADRMR